MWRRLLKRKSMIRMARHACALTCALGASVASAQTIQMSPLSASQQPPFQQLAPLPATQTLATPAPINLMPNGAPGATTQPAPAPIMIPPPLSEPDCPVPGCEPAAPASPFDWSKFRLGGQFRIEGDTNNFAQHPVSLSNNQPNDTFVNLRFRTWLTYTPTDNVEGYIQMHKSAASIGEPASTSTRTSPAISRLCRTTKSASSCGSAWLAVEGRQAAGQGAASVSSIGTIQTAIRSPAPTTTSTLAASIG